MNIALTIIFFEDHFICSIMPNESAWEALEINGSQKVLLYFYVNNSTVSNDDFAKERFESNDVNAYGDFYEVILDKSKTFKRFDMELEPIQLLRDVIEQVKSSYTDRIRVFADAFEDTDKIPLNICFVPGISRDAKELIIEYFIGQGFRLNVKADYFEAMLKILQRKGILANSKNISIVESYFGDLYFHYIEYQEKILKKETEQLVGKGVDHRIGNLAKLMVEKAARKNSSHILNDNNKDLLDQEIKKFHRRASVEINKFEYKELDVKIELSDFSSSRVIIDQRELDNMSSDSFTFIKYKFESFISRFSNLARVEKIFLNGTIFSSEEFCRFFEKVFGVGKVVKPLENFAELLSRGVVATDIHSTAVITPSRSEIEITISVSSSPPIPEFKSVNQRQFTTSAPPPPPPLPPHVVIKSINKNQSIIEPKREVAAIPPLPKSTNSAIKKKDGLQKINKIEAPPMPPMPGKAPAKKNKR